MKRMSRKLVLYLQYNQNYEYKYEYYEYEYYEYEYYEYEYYDLFSVSLKYNWRLFFSQCSALLFTFSLNFSCNHR